VALTRKTYLVLAVVLVALAAAGALYVRYRVVQAAADCPMPAPPQKPATPPPNLPGFQEGEACGPGGAPAGGASATKPEKKP
jgi:hypothetical protein